MFGLLAPVAFGAAKFVGLHLIQAIRKPATVAPGIAGGILSTLAGPAGAGVSVLETVLTGLGVRGIICFVAGLAWQDEAFRHALFAFLGAVKAALF